ncbi:MAG: hypothetical protein LUQ07_07330 [Methanospirillum sp.]|nr:hypothetical protein [Methanospirillum sp.]
MQRSRTSGSRPECLQSDRKEEAVRLAGLPNDWRKRSEEYVTKRSGVIMRLSPPM